MGIREAYQEKADAQLREWQTRIEHFKSQPEKSRLKQQLDHQQLVARLEDCHRNARGRLEELRQAEGEAWYAAKQAVEQSMIELKRTLDECGAELAERVLRLETSRAHAYQPFERKE